MELPAGPAVEAGPDEGGEDVVAHLVGASPFGQQRLGVQAGSGPANLGARQAGDGSEVVQGGGTVDDGRRRQGSRGGVSSSASLTSRVFPIPASPATTTTTVPLGAANTDRKAPSSSLRPMNGSSPGRRGRRTADRVGPAPRTIWVWSDSVSGEGETPRASRSSRRQCS